MKKLLITFTIVILGLIPLKAHAATPPTFVATTSTTYLTGIAAATISTGSIAVQTNDCLVTWGASEDAGSTGALSISGQYTWTQAQQASNGNHVASVIATTIATSTGNITVTMTRTVTTGSPEMGMTVYQFRNCSIGTSAKAEGSGAPSVNITTAANSAIVVGDGDWGAISGVSTGLANAGAFTKKFDGQDVRLAVHTGYHANSGAAATYAVGYSAPGGQTYDVMAVEVKGTSTTLPKLIIMGRIFLMGAHFF